MSSITLQEREGNILASPGLCPVEDVTFVIVNHETKHLVKDAIESLLQFYPVVRMIVLDNGSSHDNSRPYLNRIAGRHDNIRFIGLEKNVGHGPALDLCTQEAETRYVFVLDSDTRTTRGEFLEHMLAYFKKDELLFALGWVRFVSDMGVPYKHQWKREGHPYVHPSAMMFDREKYQLLCPFLNTGAPATKLMIAAIERGFHLEDFNIFDYVRHLGWGTRRLYRGHWDPERTAKMAPSAWDPKAMYRI